MPATELSMPELTREFAGPASPDPSVLWPARRRRLSASIFSWWVGRMFRKRFHALRVASGTLEHLRALDAAPGPSMVLLSHSSWWDPLIGLILCRRVTPGRLPIAPMQLDQLRKFKVLRSLGMFGLDPDRPESLGAMVRHVREECRREPRTTLWITPQGEFADVRAPVRVRPGAAAVAAELEGVRVVAIAIELAFWTDRRPEVLLRVTPVTAGTSTLMGWQRAIQSAMEQNAAELARLVIARDPAAFELLVGGRGAATHPVYDLWLRLTGRGTMVEAARRGRGRNGGGA